MYDLSFPWIGRRRAAQLLALSLSLFTAPLSDLAAQQPTTGTVRGTVTEAGTGRPMAGAQVSIKGTQRGIIADATGAYAITGVTPGAAIVRVDLIGYRSAEQPVTVVAGQTATVNIQVTESAIGLDEIVVTGTSGRGQAKRTLGNSVAWLMPRDYGSRRADPGRPAADPGPHARRDHDELERRRRRRRAHPHSRIRLA